MTERVCGGVGGFGEESPPARRSPRSSGCPVNLSRRTHSLWKGIVGSLLDGMCIPRTWTRTHWDRRRRGFSVGETFRERPSGDLRDTRTLGYYVGDLPNNLWGGKWVDRGDETSKITVCREAPREFREYRSGSTVDERYPDHSSPRTGDRGPLRNFPGRRGQSFRRRRIMGSRTLSEIWGVPKGDLSFLSGVVCPP